ncbi:MAG: hypothetical protein NXI32_01425 [bacterium]|nr:hypothetical protein [bacterium]
MNWFRIASQMIQVLNPRVTGAAGAAGHSPKQLVDSQPSLRWVPNSLVPPMRIHLELNDQDVSILGDWGKRVSAWLEAHDFVQVGRYVIEELNCEQLFAYLDPSSRLLAAIRWTPNSDEPYVEFCFLDEDGELHGIANPPASTVPLPPGSVGHFYREGLDEECALLDQMWADAKEIAASHAATVWRAQNVPAIYEQAHAREMDYRLSIGGLTEQEICEALSQQNIAPSTDDIHAIQQQWQNAIHAHLLDFSSTALNYRVAGRQILIVHDGSLKSDLVDRLSNLLKGLGQPKSQPHQRQLVSAFAELPAMMAHFAPREAIARFRPFLPPEARYELIDVLSQPVEADFYVLPP